MAEDLAPLLANLSSNNAHTVEEACFHLNLKLGGPTGFALLLTPQGKGLLELGLRHPSENVRVLVLSQLLRCTTNREGLLFLRDSSLMPFVIEAVKDDSFSVSENASKVIVGAASAAVEGEDIGTKLVFTDTNIESLHTVARDSDNENLRFRVFDLFVRLACISGNLFERCEFILRELVALLHTADVLQQLNVIELVARLAQTETGINFLMAHQVFDKLTAMLTSDDPFAYLLHNSVVGLFADLSAKITPNQQNIYTSTFFKSLTGFLNQSDPTLLTTAIGTTGKIANTEWGLSLLITDYSDTVMREWFAYADSTNATLKTAFLYSFADALRCPNEALSAKVYELLAATASDCPALFPIIMKIFDTPFEELRGSAYAVLNALVQSRWGLTEAFQRPGFYEWLLSRPAATPGNGSSQWHFRLVAQVMRWILHPSSSSNETKSADWAESVIGGPERVMRLRAFLREGEIYIPTQTVVGIDYASV
eukprot:TRINITY_DN3249_c0_g1_i1.p1 TRINITY_DN3249_c0_g1~~TRINITY_DN3249_c0_g1_i1.p1  ORF type:complete len:492 (-),score=72.04 TRINITY_DN3249_c0_g1_i1:35-1480(-)